MNHSEKAETLSKKVQSDCDLCVICGAPVPEGRMACWICEHEIEKPESTDSIMLPYFGNN